MREEFEKWWKTQETGNIHINSAIGSAAYLAWEAAWVHPNRNKHPETLLHWDGKDTVITDKAVYRTQNPSIPQTEEEANEAKLDNHPTSKIY